MTYPHTLGDREVERWSAVVLYEPGSGRIAHMHQCITLKGGEHPTRKQLERDARHGLRQTAVGHTTPRRLLALHVDPRTLTLEHHYTVDSKRRVLVKTPQRAIARSVRPTREPPPEPLRRQRSASRSAGWR